MKEKTQYSAWLVLLVMLDGILVLINMTTGGAENDLYPINPPLGVLGLPPWIKTLELILGIASVFFGLKFKYFRKYDNNRFSNYLIIVGVILIGFSLFTFFIS